jgi:hypothetical protein
MMLMRIAGLVILLLVSGCASSVVTADRVGASEEFVGSTPCDVRALDFLGGLATNAPCHCVTWRLTLFTNQQTRLPSTYSLVADYGLPGRTDTNQLENGPTVKLSGTWEILPGPAGNPRATVYRLHGQRGPAPDLVRLGEHIYHFLDSSNRLMIGNGGWSYTLNRKGLGYEN